MTIFKALFLALFIASSAFAASPLVIYNWHNQITSSEVTINRNGTIRHIEKLYGKGESIPEKSLPSPEVERIKKIIEILAEAKIDQKDHPQSMGSKSGGIYIVIGDENILVEGVIRNLKKGTLFQSEARDEIAELTQIIYSYASDSQSQMDF